MPSHFSPIQSVTWFSGFLFDGVPVLAIKQDANGSGCAYRNGPWSSIEQSSTLQVQLDLSTKGNAPLLELQLPQ
jgi:hypothetical protein